MGASRFTAAVGSGRASALAIGERVYGVNPATAIVLAPGVAVNTYTAILIDSNMIIRQSDPNLAFPG